MQIHVCAVIAELPVSEQMWQEIAEKKCKQRAIDVIYWPNINSDVCDFVSRYDICRRIAMHSNNSNYSRMKVQTGLGLKLRVTFST